MYLDEQAKIISPNQNF